MAFDAGGGTSCRAVASPPRPPACRPPVAAITLMSNVVAPIARHMAGLIRRREDPAVLSRDRGRRRRHRVLYETVPAGSVGHVPGKPDRRTAAAMRCRPPRSPPKLLLSALAVASAAAARGARKDVRTLVGHPLLHGAADAAAAAPTTPPRALPFRPAFAAAGLLESQYSMRRPLLRDAQRLVDRFGAAITFAAQL